MDKFFLSAVVQIDVEVFENGDYTKADNRKWFFYFVSLFWISYTTFWLDKDKTVSANVNSDNEYTDTSSYNVVLYYALVGAIIVKFGKTDQKCEEKSKSSKVSPQPGEMLGDGMQAPPGGSATVFVAAKEFNISGMFNRAPVGMEKETFTTTTLSGEQFVDMDAMFANNFETFDLDRLLLTLVLVLPLIIETTVNQFTDHMLNSSLQKLQVSAFVASLFSLFGFTVFQLCKYIKKYGG